MVRITKCCDYCGLVIDEKKCYGILGSGLIIHNDKCYIDAFVNKPLTFKHIKFTILNNVLFYWLRLKVLWYMFTYRSKKKMIPDNGAKCAK
jgi:hypothetical protein